METSDQMSLKFISALTFLRAQKPITEGHVFRFIRPTITSRAQTTTKAGCEPVEEEQREGWGAANGHRDSSESLSFGEDRNVLKSDEGDRCKRSQHTIH